MPARWRRAAGVRVEPLGQGWVAYSGLSGETLLLNDEGAAVLEVLAGAAGASAAEIATSLAADVGAAAPELEPRIDASLPGLVRAGLVQPG